MGLLVCFCCGHQKEINPIPRGAKYRCGNCGAKRVRIIRSKAHASYISWVDKDGGDAEEARHTTYAGLKRYAEHRGYKSGWTWHKFKEIFGRPPNGEAVESPAPASNGLLRWVRQQNAAFAKTKREIGLDSGSNRVSMRGADISGRGTDNVAATSPLMTEDDWGVKL